MGWTKSRVGKKLDYLETQPFFQSTYADKSNLTIHTTCTFIAVRF